MKIAFIVPGFSADESDWCIPAHTDLVRALAETHTVHVFAMRYPHHSDTYAIGRATVHSFNGVGSRGAASARLWLRVLRAVEREHRRAPFDVVQSIFGGEAGCFATLAGKRLRVPSVVWLVNGELVGLPEIGYGADLMARQSWLNKLALGYANRILTGSEALTEAARARLSGQRADRVETLPLGVNTARFPLHPRGANANAALVNVGSLLPVKDQAALLRAFARVREQVSGATLSIAGGGPLEAELNRLADELGIRSAVTFAGNLPHDQLPELYQRADVFVQSSRHEGQGMALLEAAASGCAVCGTAVGALRDLARQDAAIAVPPGSADALAGAILDTLRAPLSERARAGEIARCEYNLERICARLETMYRKLAAPRPKDSSGDNPQRPNGIPHP